MVYSDVKKELLNNPNNPNKELVEEVLNEVLDIYGECFVDLGIVGEDSLIDWVNNNPNINKDDICDLFTDSQIVSEYLIETGLEPIINILDELIENFE